MSPAITKNAEYAILPESAGVTNYIRDNLAAPEDSTDHVLALQVIHSLRHEHNWTALELHTISPLSPFTLLPRPLVSGLPPHRLYMHPDEQIELLKEAKNRKKDADAKTKEGDEDNKGAETSKKRVAKSGQPSGLDLQAEPEREWVLPTRLNEKWSLRRMAEIFDTIGIIPPENATTDTLQVQKTGQKTTAEDAASTKSKWRTCKRVLMAIVDHDSTISYYIVQEGLVKPRQN
ncbi:hypothetical protein EJ05DRAFT_374713 [Pseudovirgaria hyperparasitica]|uniref:tRNA-splicing endonuclease subunit Sen15 domain-containing protein n=1 Tax=Pseudovirgaria hyperparasitica TaxID=470096 RepID=A0A6A6W812_9PEZI|nr:uncharacterized protein EJ05DRAFT_374713 [Pseudovirgaria hyperparasitica]KAF2758026.1 hypothetical protein EJ05DRAFT_374713 [Pseudovirgaria hyperparasitica]